MTLEDFKIWYDTNLTLEDKACDFFTYIQYNYSNLLIGPPSKCWYDCIEACSKHALIIKYGCNDEYSSIRVTDIELFLESLAAAAKKWAEEVLEIRRKNKEKEDKLKQEQIEEYQKDMTEYRRIKAKYNL